ncbi:MULTISPECIES: hypothetical protein [Rickettsieae]|uniref:hypothetical protein n=1 Tax=Rickettsieae TaxID=33988 RepID=UPI000B9B27A0|nr:hypothetical protein [Rickettsia endosymbiont of Culicoides newsteadi]OZG31389.1 hypothetical protein RiCNE_12250 [Rickettsia endosymbiont of Culicoides newsteadi]
MTTINLDQINMDNQDDPYDTSAEEGKEINENKKIDEINDIDKLKGKLQELSGRLISLSIQTSNTNKRIESSLKMLTTQLYDMRKNMDFIRAYIEVGIVWDEDD